MKNYAVIAIVENNGRILVGKKIEKSEKFLSNTWHIPGGKIGKNETDEEALIREIQEEAGIEIEVKSFLDNSITPTGKRAHWYLCSSSSSDINPGDDLIDVKFIPKANVRETCDEKSISLWPPKVVEYFNQ